MLGMRGWHIDRFAREYMSVPHFLLTWTSRQLNGELTGDQVGHRALDYGKSSEVGEPSCSAFDLAERLGAAKHQDAQHRSNLGVEVPLIGRQVLELHHPRVARLNCTDE